METKEALLKYLIPTIGGITAVLLSLSPLPSILKIRKENYLGNCNPIPFAFILVNALVWIEYGTIVLKDPFVVTPNLIGFGLGLFYLNTVYGLTENRKQILLNAISIGFSVLIFIFSVISNMGLRDNNGEEPGLKSNLMFGILSVTILALFYTSPLTVLFKVVKTRNSIYFSLPLAVTSIVNGSFWAVYGFTQSNPFIWGPNLLGASFALLQIVCRILFRARPIDVLPEHDRKVLSSTSEGSFNKDEIKH